MYVLVSTLWHVSCKLELHTNFRYVWRSLYIDHLQKQNPLTDSLARPSETCMLMFQGRHSGDREVQLFGHFSPLGQEKADAHQAKLAKDTGISSMETWGLNWHNTWLGKAGLRVAGKIRMIRTTCWAFKPGVEMNWNIIGVLTRTMVMLIFTNTLACCLLSQQQGGWTQFVGVVQLPVNFGWLVKLVLSTNIMN